MAKRFASTEIWDEDWFLEMPNEYKLFWHYMLSACDHAGLFKVNVRVFCATHSIEIIPMQAVEYFNKGKDRIRIIRDNFWLIEDFFVFQYGTTFNPNNRVHESIENAYNKANIKMTSIRGLIDLKERVKDKDKDKDIKKGGKGENKNNKGTCFDDGFVVLESGKKQFLGNSQKIRFKNGDIKPEEIYEGYIV